jgi:hypothetical protein
MNTEIKKWRLVGGQIYRLADVFDDFLLAIQHAKELKKERYVLLTKAGDSRWAVYWRCRADKSECPPELYKIY